MSETLLNPLDLYDELIAMRKEEKGMRKGISTGILDLDNYISLNKKYLMLVTGSGGMGKSELLDQIALNTARVNGWGWVFYSPENYPASEHAKKFTEKFIGKGLWECTPKEIEKALTDINEQFTWINPDTEANTPRELCAFVKEVKKTKRVDAYVFDPWNEMNHTGQADMRDDQYISIELTAIRRFNRRQDLLGCIVIHPKGLQRDKEGNYPVPTLSDCHGGIMWRNKADYGLCVHRHDMNKDEATVYIQKVKMKSHGKFGVLDLDYEYRTGRFKCKGDQDYTPVWEIKPPF